MALAAALPLALTTGAVRADTAPPDTSVPTTVSADALPTAQMNGVGWQQTILNGTVYVVGDFSAARPAGAAPGVNEVPRHNILAYDLQTGQLVSGFHPQLNAEARAVTSSPNGSVLYVGGSFTTVDGTKANRIVALDPRTGARISSFKVSADASVRAIAASSDTVWLGGAFSKVNGQPRSHLAAVKAADGSLRPFAPTTNARVNALALSPDRTKLVVGGAFTQLNGSDHPGYGLGAVDSSTGSSLPFPVNDTIRDAGSNASITSLTSDGTNVYGTGASFSFSDGNFEGAFAARWSDFSLAFMEDCHGDSYGAAVTSDVMYVVGHAHQCTGVGAFPDSNPSTHWRGLAFTKRATRTLQAQPSGSSYQSFTGKPAPSLLVWFPRLETGSYTGQNQGPWAVAATGRYVVMAGEFPTVNGAAQQGLVRFAVPDTAPNRQGPRLSGSAFTPTAQDAGGGRVDVSWGANWDRDNEQLTYKVFRDGTVVSTQSRLSTFWQLPQLSYRDTGVPAGSHSYKVKAIDPFGNAITSPTVTVVSH